MLRGGRDADDGENVVLHELAHHLDGLDGEMGGSPPLPTHDAETIGATSSSRDCDQLCREVLAEGRHAASTRTARREHKRRCSPYGTECFFERPLAMRRAASGVCSIASASSTRSIRRAWFDGAAAGASRTARRERTGDVASEDENADDQQPSPADLPPLETADQYFTRGQEYFQPAATTWPLPTSTRLRADAPRRSGGAGLTGQSRYCVQDHIEAGTGRCRRACRLEPEDPEARRSAAMCLSALRRYSKPGCVRPGGNADRADDAEALFCRGMAQRDSASCARRWPISREPSSSTRDDAEAHSDARAAATKQLGNAVAAQSRLAARERESNAEAARERRDRSDSPLASSLSCPAPLSCGHPPSPEPRHVPHSAASSASRRSARLLTYSLLQTLVARDAFGDGDEAAGGEVAQGSERPEPGREGEEAQADRLAGEGR